MAASPRPDHFPANGAAPWDAARSVELSFAPGSPLVALLLRQADVERLPVRRQLDLVTSAAAIEIPNASVLLSSHAGGGSVELLRLDESLALVNLGRGRLSLHLASPDDAAAGAAIERLRAAFPEPQAATERQEVLFEFCWLQAAGHVRWVSRTLSVPSWRESRANYASEPRRRLDRLMRSRLAERSGQTIIWHGEPGTGKTSALRALAWKWREWCTVQVVTDPDQLFGASAAYLLELIAAPPWRVGRRHRLIVLEDAGELLAARARSDVGHGLSRFLNVCDGLLGQDENLTLLVTTNEPIRRLHPAVVRPGRCAAQIEFTALPVRSANRWLARHGSKARVSRPTVLADLYALVDGRQLEQRERTQSVGFSAALEV